MDTFCWMGGVVALLAELLRREVPVVVVSSVPRWFFEESLEGLDYISTQVRHCRSPLGR
jgi:phosphoglycolate phosphatase-like HAD superfamily hydrolase